MVQSLDYLKETPSQTAGPYVHIGLIPDQAGFHIYEKNLSNMMAAPGTAGEHITIEGIVYDGTGAPVRDILLEIWQADSDGHYNHPADSKGYDPKRFSGFGRAGSDFKTGLYTFKTVKPGSVTGRNGRKMAPHVTFWLVSRGINIGLNTRMYFADEAGANAADPVLNLIEQEARRATLIAKRETRDGSVVYRFDIRLQGEGETVFFDV